MAVGFATWGPAVDRPTEQPFEPSDEFRAAYRTARAFRAAQRIEMSLVIEGHERSEITRPSQFRRYDRQRVVNAR